MRIYISNYNNYKRSYGRAVQISNSHPSWFTVDAKIPELFPEWNLVERWNCVKKRPANDIEKQAVMTLFTDAYMQKLVALGNGIMDLLHDNDVLLCWCTKDTFCHRYILQSYLERYFNVEVVEI